MKYSDLRINSFSLLGAELTPTNVNAVFVAMWIIWLYFLIRYYQYYRQEGLSNLNSAWFVVSDVCLSRKMNEIIVLSYPDLDTRHFIVKYSQFGRVGAFKKRYFAKAHSALQGKDIDITISTWKFWREWAKAIVLFVRNHSQFTDYILPILVAVFTFVYCGMLGWQGSILKLICP
jgi:hypothetical protein